MGQPRKAKPRLKARGKPLRHAPWGRPCSAEAEPGQPLPSRPAGTRRGPKEPPELIGKGNRSEEPFGRPAEPGRKSLATNSPEVVRTKA